VTFKHDAEILAYQILDLDGQVLQENQIEPRIDGICSIPLEGLPAGTYTIRLMTEGVPDFSQQFIIAKD
jgi:hypothetical protein